MTVATLCSRPVPSRSRFGAGIARRAAGVIVLAGALVNATVGVLSLLAPSQFLAFVGQSSQELTPAASVFAAYAGARELGVAIALLVLLAMRRVPLLAGALTVAALANLVDAALAVAAQRWVQLPGALAFTLAYAIAAVWLPNTPPTR